MDVSVAAAATTAQVLRAVGTTADGLAAAEAARRLMAAGPNAVRTHQARLLPVLGRQLRSPLLLLLAVTAAASYFVGGAQRRSDHRDHSRRLGGPRLRE
jgi:Mg2+-importing ATPase